MLVKILGQQVGLLSISPLEGMTKGFLEEVMMKPMAKLSHRQQHLV
jgi:hypothetical protein